MAARDRVPDPGRWVHVRLPDGRAALVTTAFEHGQKVVVVKPLTKRSGDHGSR